MGQKVHPEGFRLCVNHKWSSKYFASSDKEYSKYVIEDERIRRLIKKKFGKTGAIAKIIIERAANRVRVKIYTARPGSLIGRKGQELEKLKDELQSLTDSALILDTVDIKKPDIVAQLVAESVALMIERRTPFRRAMKMSIQKAMSYNEVDGIKIEISGRLAGADIARTEKQREGRVPLQTLRENISYGFAEAETVYGIIGVKCWMCLNVNDLGF